jgi:hypothetical protein
MKSRLSPAQYQRVADLENLNRVQELMQWSEAHSSRRIHEARDDDPRWHRRRMKRLARYAQLVEQGKPTGGSR